MLERDIQDYLLQHPEALFPGQVIDEVRKEYPIGGRRIDLLFKVDGTRYIVELKRDSIEREHIGQIVEYYGLLKESMREERIRMILVAPRIPSFRRIYLEELGIQCVELSVPFDSKTTTHSLAQVSRTYRKTEQIRGDLEGLFPEGTPLAYKELSRSATPLALAMTHRVLRHSLEDVRRAFVGYETIPIRMAHAESPDIYISPRPISQLQIPAFESGGAWWAYGFGPSENMPKNDVPNISMASMPGSLDLAINAEIQASQRVLLKRIAEDPEGLNSILRSFPGLEFQAWLKLEHQPRFYHWIPIEVFPPGSWNASRVCTLHQTLEAEFHELREDWLARLSLHQTRLSERQKSHLENKNRSLNLAMRIVRPFGAFDELWSRSYSEQVAILVQEISRLRPLIDYFLKR